MNPKDLEKVIEELKTVNLEGKNYTWDEKDKNYMITEENGEKRYFQEGVGEITEQQYLDRP